MQTAIGHHIVGILKATTVSLSAAMSQSCPSQVRRRHPRSRAPRPPQPEHVVLTLAILNAPSLYYSRPKSLALQMLVGNIPVSPLNLEPELFLQARRNFQQNHLRHRSPSFRLSIRHRRATRR